MAIVPDSAGPGSVQSTAAVPRGAEATWLQNVVLEPVHSLRGFVAFTVREVRRQRAVGRAETSLRALCDQEPHERTLAIALDPRFSTSLAPRLQVRAIFSFSQTAKLQQRRVALEAKRAHVLTQMQQLQHVAGPAKME